MLFNHFCVPNGPDYVSPEVYSAFKEAFYGSSVVEKSSTVLSDIA